MTEPHAAEPDDAPVSFVLQLARALHTYGHPAGRLEDVLGLTADRLGIPGHQFFSTPTSLMASFGAESHQRTHLLRVEPGEVNLGGLARLERVALEVAGGHTTPEAGSREIARIVSAPAPYGPGLTTIAHGAVSGASCVFLGGGAREIVVATVLGLGVGLLSLVAQRARRLGRVFEPLAAFLVSFAALGLGQLWEPLSTLVATISGLIVLLPGFTLTTALAELATRHLASGTARLSGAAITFLATAFGVALGNRIGIETFGVVPVVQPALPPWWASLTALALAPLAFTVILRADRRDAPWIVLAGVLGYAGGRIGAATLGAQLGAFAGSFVVGLASATFERWRRRPAAVVQVPGILLLVPGSVGFRSLLALMDQEAVAGIETAFNMLMTAIALVAGLLIAGVVVPERRVTRDG